MMGKKQRQEIINSVIHRSLRIIKLKTYIRVLNSIQYECPRSSKWTEEPREELRNIIRACINQNQRDLAPIFNGNLFGEIKFEDGRNWLVSKSITETPIDYFSLEDINRGEIPLTKIEIHRDKKKVRVTNLSFRMKDGILIPIERNTEL